MSTAVARQYLQRYAHGAHLLVHSNEIIAEMPPEFRDSMGSDHGHLTAGSIEGLVQAAVERYETDGECLRILEFAAHGSPVHVPLGGDGLTSRIDKNNAFQVGQLLRKLVPFERDWCAIILTSCNAGLDRRTDSMPAMLAKGSGCWVLAAGGYVRGQFYHSTVDVYGYANDAGVPSKKWGGWGAESYKATVEYVIQRLRGRAEKAETLRKWEDLWNNIHDSENDSWYLFRP